MPCSGAAAFEPRVIKAQALEVPAQQAAVVDDDLRQEHVVPHVEPQLARRRGLTVRAPGGRRAVRSSPKWRISRRRDCHALCAQRLEQLVEREPVAAHGRLLELPVADDDGGLPADKAAKAHAVQAAPAQKHRQRQQRHDRHKAVEQPGMPKFCIGTDARSDKSIVSTSSTAPAPRSGACRQAQTHDQDEIEDHGADQCGHHRYIPPLLAVSAAWGNFIQVKDGHPLFLIHRRRKYGGFSGFFPAASASARSGGTTRRREHRSFRRELSRDIRARDTADKYAGDRKTEGL